VILTFKTVKSAKKIQTGYAPNKVQMPGRITLVRTCHETDSNHKVHLG